VRNSKTCESNPHGPIPCCSVSAIKSPQKLRTLRAYGAKPCVPRPLDVSGKTVWGVGGAAACKEGKYCPDRLTLFPSGNTLLFADWNAFGSPNTWVCFPSTDQLVTQARYSSVATAASYPQQNCSNPTRCNMVPQQQNAMAADRATCKGSIKSELTSCFAWLISEAKPLLTTHVMVPNLTFGWSTSLREHITLQQI
jgi:hypothetical protein